MDKENSACVFRDERLKKRFRLLLEPLLPRCQARISADGCGNSDA
ncbi:hypothetical protein [Rugamonas apoptosis]